MHLLGERPLRGDSEALADEQHPDRQLRIDRRAARVAVELREVTPQIAEIERPVDTTQWRICW